MEVGQSIIINEFQSVVYEIKKYVYSFNGNKYQTVWLFLWGQLCRGGKLLNKIIGWTMTTL